MPKLPDTAAPGAGSGPTFVSDNFVKIYANMLESSIWLESKDTRLLWITMLAMADSNGIVRASVGGLAHRARVSREECEEGLRILSAPDPDSRSAEHEGRRIGRIDGGWLILNHKKYRDLRTESQLKAAARKQRQRERELEESESQRNGAGEGSGQ